MTPHPLEDLTIADYLGPASPPVPARARNTALALGTVLAETLSGQRSPNQFSRWLTPTGCQRLSNWVRTNRQRPTKLARCQLTMVDDHVEARLSFSSGERTVAVAMRLDESEPGWRCSQLEVLLPGNAP